MDPNGNAVFVWQRGQRSPSALKVEARARSAAGNLSAIQTVHPNVSIFWYGGHPEVAVDRSGNAVFAWLFQDYPYSEGGCGEYNEYSCFQVQTRVRSVTGSLSPIQGLSYFGSRHSAGVASIGVDPNGNAVYVWSIVDWNNYDCALGNFPCFRVQARARSAAGSLSGTPFLSAAGADGYGARLGVDQSGNAVLVWRLFDYTCDCSWIEARIRSAAGTLGATQALSGTDASSPDIGVDPTGNAVIVWIKSGGGTNCGGASCNRIEARARSAAGALGPSQFLSAAGQHAQDPHVGIAQSGNAVAVWRRFDGANWRIQAAAGP
jgi:hypothetical protein